MNELTQLFREVTKEFQPYILKVKVHVVNKPQFYCWVEDITNKDFDETFECNDENDIRFIQNKDRFIKADLYALVPDVGMYAIAGFVKEYECVLIEPETVDAFNVKVKEIKNKSSENPTNVTIINNNVQNKGKQTIDFTQYSQYGIGFGCTKEDLRILNAKNMDFVSQQLSQLKLSNNAELTSNNKIYIGKYNNNKINTFIPKKFYKDKKDYDLIDVLKTHILKGDFSNKDKGDKITSSLLSIPEYSTKGSIINKDYYKDLYKIKNVSNGILFSRLYTFTNEFETDINNTLQDVVYDEGLKGEYEVLKLNLINSYGRFENSTAYLKEIEKFLNEYNYQFFISLLQQILKETNDNYRLNTSTIKVLEQPSKEYLEAKKKYEDTQDEIKKIRDEISDLDIKITTLNNSIRNINPVGTLYNQIKNDIDNLKKKRNDLVDKSNDLTINDLDDYGSQMQLLAPKEIDKQVSGGIFGISKTRMQEILNETVFTFENYFIEDKISEEHEKIQADLEYSENLNLNSILTRLNTNISDLIENIKKLTTANGVSTVTTNYISAAPGSPCINNAIPIIYPALDNIKTNLEQIQNNVDDILAK